MTPNTIPIVTTTAATTNSASIIYYFPFRIVSLLPAAAGRISHTTFNYHLLKNPVEKLFHTPSPLQNLKVIG